MLRGTAPVPSKNGTGFVQPLTPFFLAAARRLVAEFVEHYNQTRLHSDIRYVTPADKLLGRDKAIHEARDQKLAEARERRRQCRETDRERAANPSQSVAPTAAPARRPIDYVVLRGLVTMAAVLQLLGFRAVSKHGAKHRGPCPLHGSTRSTTRCFAAELERDVFHCFKCGQQDNGATRSISGWPRPSFRSMMRPSSSAHD